MELKKKKKSQVNVFFQEKFETRRGGKEIRHYRFLQFQSKNFTKKKKFQILLAKITSGLAILQIELKSDPGQFKILIFNPFTKQRYYKISQTFSSFFFF